MRPGLSGRVEGAIALTQAPSASFWLVRLLPCGLCSENLPQHITAEAEPNAYFHRTARFREQAFAD